MKKFNFTASLLISALAFSNIALADKSLPTVYINENLGFNVPGYNYKQSSFPCDIDKYLVEELVSQGQRVDINMEPARTADKILNGKIPVLAMDVEQLVLGSEEHSYGAKSRTKLPKVQVTAAFIVGEEMTSAKHTCAIATLNEFTPSTNVLDLGTTVSVCTATRKCLRDLSKDIVGWVQPQVK